MRPTLRIYRGPDDESPPRRPDPPEWWAKDGFLSVGEFVAAFHVSTSTRQGLGISPAAWAKKHGAHGRRRLDPSTHFGVVSRWPVAVLAEFFDGRMVDGVVLDCSPLLTDVDHGLDPVDVAVRLDDGRDERRRTA